MTWNISITGPQPPQGGGGGSAPSYFVNNLLDGVWGEIAAGAGRTDLPLSQRGQRISDVLPSPSPRTSLPGENDNGIVDSWSSGACAQDYGEFLLAGTGGHADYPGNEGYRCALRVETPGFVRMSDPSPQSVIGSLNDSTPETATYSDGRPRAMHASPLTYGDGRIWFTFDNSVTSGGGGGGSTYLSYNRAALGTNSSPLAWTSSDLGPWEIGGDASGTVPNGAGQASFGISVFDRLNHNVYGFGGKGVDDQNTVIWRIGTGGGANALGHLDGCLQAGNSDMCSANCWGVHAYDLGIMIVGNGYLSEGGAPTNGSDNEICVLTVANYPSSAAFKAVPLNKISGATRCYGSGSGGVYDVQNHSIIICDPKRTGKQLYRLQIPMSGGVYDPNGTWIWTTTTPSGNGPDPSSFARPTANNNCLGKFNIIEDMGNGQSCIFCLTAIGGPLFALKVPVGGFTF